jgi:pseudouridine-5'-phosphate glycosidase
MTAQNQLRISEQVGRAIRESRPVVALESTVIAHGLPAPLNIETARDCENAVRAEGAVPATIGVVKGVPTIGLDEGELDAFARGGAVEPCPIEKVGLNNLAAVMTNRGWGATTVAATLRIAALGGLRVFSTGGIGGVHRGAAESFDVSADLTALARTPMVCVCAGAKAILDLPKTIEYLETMGVPVVGYQTEEFPGFYSRASGLAVDFTARSADEAAEMALNHWQSGGETAVLVCVPVPEEFEMPLEEVEGALDEALGRAARAGVRGKALTPFLLSEMKDITEGVTLSANRGLLVNNAAVAARIAVSLQRMMRE